MQGPVTAPSPGSITISKCKPKNASVQVGVRALPRRSRLVGISRGRPAARRAPLTTRRSVRRVRVAAPPGAPRREDATGTVTSISKGNTYTPIGQVISLRVCVDSGGNITLVPGTKAEI